LTRKYGSLEVLGDSGCSSCKEMGGDSTSNHLVHWRNTETGDEWGHCNRCDHRETITDSNRGSYVANRKVSRVLSDEEVASVLEETLELPIKALRSRGITQLVSERFGVRVGVSSIDGETPISHFYPKTVNHELTGYKVRSLDPKYFYSIGRGRNCDLFGINQSKRGDVWTGKLFLFEDELSAMSGYQILTSNTKSLYSPAVCSLPDGAGSAAASLQRNQVFVESFTEIVVCMDNDDAGEDALRVIRSLYPHVKVARIPKGKKEDGSAIKDANDMLMEGRELEMFNALRYSASQDTPDAAVGIAECMEEALKKPEWG
jgi:twinkle protein